MVRASSEVHEVGLYMFSAVYVSGGGVRRLQTPRLPSQTGSPIRGVLGVGICTLDIEIWSPEISYLEFFPSMTARFAPLELKFFTA